MTEQAYRAVDIIKQRCPDFSPTIAIVLGSGLGALADDLTNTTSFNYDELPGFPPCSVQGHSGQLICGYWNDLPIACMKGRVHFYEGIDNIAPQTMMRTLKLLGTETLLATNAAGSLRPEVTPGNLVIINDHINFQFNNPLVGPNDDRFGPRFLGVETLYNDQLKQQLHDAAKAQRIEVTEGVYFGTLGPTFETPAEIKAYRILGADVVGMSTIPEVITAHHCGIHVAVVSVITNLAAGMSQEHLSHELTLEGATKGANKLQQLTREFLSHYQTP